MGEIISKELFKKAQVVVNQKKNIQQDSNQTNSRYTKETDTINVNNAVYEMYYIAIYYHLEDKKKTSLIDDQKYKFLSNSVSLKYLASRACIEFPSEIPKKLNDREIDLLIQNYISDYIRFQNKSIRHLKNRHKTNEQIL